MARSIATNTVVGLSQLLDFVRPRHWSPISTGGFPADVAARLDAPQ